MDRRTRVAAALAGVRQGWPRRAVYAVLSVPLAAVYAALFAGLVTSVVLAVQGVGLLLFLALLATARGFGGLERRLARRLLGVDTAPAERLRAGRGRVRRLRLLVLSSSTWRTVAWLGARVLLGAGIAATALFGVLGVAVTVSEPPWGVWTALPLLLLLVAVAVVVVTALELQVRLAAAVAPALLGVAPEERIAALQQTSQRLADRNRLARDLHDTIGHALTASLLQATAARRTLAGAEPDTAFAGQALGHIETNTRAALAELDRALAVLRDGGAAEADATPDLRNLDGLLAGLRDGGLPVTLTLEVPPDELPAPVSALAYRVVQEGTTNVLRHAGCPPTTVQVARTGDAVTVRVRNRAAADAGSRPGPGGGHGLAGLRDRTAALGGHLATGPTPGGGFEVCATLPLRRPA